MGLWGSGGHPTEGVTCMTLFSGDGWRRSTRCESFDCVEVTADGARVLVRATAAGPVVTYDPDAWQAFCVAVSRGELARRRGS
jgi:hypothetical protein